jgi:hypothetical protein
MQDVAQSLHAQLVRGARHSLFDVGAAIIC